MSHRIPAIVAITLAVCTVSGVAIFAQSPAEQSVLTRSRYLPEYTPAGELKLPENSMWRSWIFVGTPLTPNALNGGQANFPEYHYVYIEPGSYDIYRKTGIFPDGTFFSRSCCSPRGLVKTRMARERSLRVGVISRACSTGRTRLSRTRSGLPTPVAGGTSISIITSRRLRPPRSKINRNARFAISAPPRETRFGRSSTLFWTRSLFPKVAEADALSSA